MPLSGFTETSQGLSQVVRHGGPVSLLPSSAVLSMAKLRAWIYHSIRPFSCKCSLISSASLYTFLLKHPFRMAIALPGNSSASLLISGVFSCHDLPCHFKINAPWSLWDFGLPHPHCLNLQVWIYLLLFPNQGERIFSLHLLCFRQFFCQAAASPLCFCHSKKKVVFSFLLASLAVILLSFVFFPNYSLLTILLLHPKTVSQSTSWERIPSCDNQASSSTMESPHSLLLERVFPGSQSRYKVTLYTPKKRIQICLEVVSISAHVSSLLTRLSPSLAASFTFHTKPVSSPGPCHTIICPGWSPIIWQLCSFSKPKYRLSYSKLLKIHWNRKCFVQECHAALLQPQQNTWAQRWFSHQLSSLPTEICLQSKGCFSRLEQGLHRFCLKREKLKCDVFFFSFCCSVRWIEGTSTYLRVWQRKNESFSSLDFHWGQYNQDKVLKHRPVLQEHFTVYQTNDTLVGDVPIYASTNNASEKKSLQETDRTIIIRWQSHCLCNDVVTQHPAVFPHAAEPG